ncbi:transposase [Micromonospora matsumotoense]|uniref:transposase n=1 Tax=Micromonospora matsumotoense TaxID=121616 RepID=UPI00343EC9BB
MADKKNAVQLPQPSAAAEVEVEVEFAQQLVERAKADGVSLVGPGGLLAGIARMVLESALDAELDAYLDEVGVDEATGRRVNVRIGHGAKTVQIEVGPVRIQVPRDRVGSFTPRIVPKHARRLEGFNEAILSLYAKGLTTGEISAHLADVYDAEAVGGEVAVHEVVVHRRPDLATLAAPLALAEGAPPTVVRADPPRGAIRHRLPGRAGLVDQEPVPELRIVAVASTKAFAR